MDVSEAIEKRRSIRKFSEKSIPEELVDELIKAAMFAPTARNRRPVHLIIVKERSIIEKIRKLRESAFTFLESAPLAIVVAVKDYDTWESDGAIAAAFMQLRATSLGLGSCWGHVANRVEKEMKELLKIPEGFRVLCVLGFGYPAEKKPPHTEEEINRERIHENSW